MPVEKLKISYVRSIGVRQLSKYEPEIVNFTLLIDGDNSKQEVQISFKSPYRACQ